MPCAPCHGVCGPLCCPCFLTQQSRQGPPHPSPKIRALCRDQTISMSPALRQQWCLAPQATWKQPLCTCCSLLLGGLSRLSMLVTAWKQPVPVPVLGLMHQGQDWQPVRVMRQRPSSCSRPSQGIPTGALQLNMQTGTQGQGTVRACGAPPACWPAQPKRWCTRCCATLGSPQQGLQLLLQPGAMCWATSPSGSASGDSPGLCLLPIPRLLLYGPWGYRARWSGDGCALQTAQQPTRSSLEPSRPQLAGTGLHGLHWAALTGQSSAGSAQACGASLHLGP